jgi:hypothetical protein
VEPLDVSLSLLDFVAETARASTQPSRASEDPDIAAYYTFTGEE